MWQCNSHDDFCFIGVITKDMNFLYFLLIGLIAGWLAGELWKGDGFGLLGNMIVGILGALIGGWVFGLLGFSADSLLGQLVMATLGAIIFLFVLGLVGRGRGKNA